MCDPPKSYEGQNCLYSHGRYSYGLLKKTCDSPNYYEGYCCPSSELLAQARIYKKQVIYLLPYVVMALCSYGPI